MDNHWRKVFSRDFIYTLKDIKRRIFGRGRDFIYFNFTIDIDNKVSECSPMSTPIRTSLFIRDIFIFKVGAKSRIRPLKGFDLSAEVCLM